MTGALKDWKDALEDLGLLGFVPPPLDLQSLVAPAEASTQENPAPPPARPNPRPAPASAPVPRPSSPAATWTPPTDPMGCPSAAGVAQATSLQELERHIQACQACPLGGHRLRFVFGEGSPSARLMFIGEGPGRDEDLQGRPFVGKAGELLDKMIQAMGFQRADVYIANVVKCRPPDNRTPLPSEAAACLGYLRRQIELVGPKVIVTLGATPLRELLGVQTGITKVRGQWQRLDMLGGLPIMPTFHPAYVLRQYTLDVRKAVWDDLLAVKAWLEGAPEAPPR